MKSSHVWAIWFTVICVAILVKIAPTEVFSTRPLAEGIEPTTIIEILSTKPLGAPKEIPTEDILLSAKEISKVANTKYFDKNPAHSADVARLFSGNELVAQESNGLSFNVYGGVASVSIKKKKFIVIFHGSDSKSPLRVEFNADQAEKLKNFRVNKVSIFQGTFVGMDGRFILA